MRDSIQSKGYFLKVIEYQYSRIEKFEKFYETLPDKNSAGAHDILQNIALFKKNLFTAMYSVGETKEKIRMVVFEYMRLIMKVGDFSYADAIDILSLAILFEIDYNELESFIRQIEFEDDLIGYLISAIKKEKFIPRTENLMFREKYVGFVEFIKENDADKFTAYMENQWYDLNENMYWYNTHKSKYDTYMGYWCWIAAAILKIKQNPAKDKNIMYVPKDLI